MTPFLKQVAEHYFTESLATTCFVFPNRRALVFFRKYLSECVVRSGRPLIAPEMYTMNDFFYTAAGASATPRIPLLLELYRCYSRLNPKAEPLDGFIFWGDVLLGDFGDVDKYLVDPAKLFRNIADLKELQGDLDYLDPVQREAIERFISHFKDNFGADGRYKDEFRRIWDILLPLYTDFNAALQEKGMSYEGAVYRRLATRLREESAADVMRGVFGDTSKFVFVGLNALNECEKVLMRKLHNAGMAEFCWDFSSSMIRDADNRSSFFMSANVAEFPQAFSLDPDGLPEPEFNVLSVPSASGQAKQLPGILRKVGARGIETAVVLPDENLLLPVLSSIPGEIGSINVTMGYSMKNSGLWSLMKDIAALQQHMRLKDGKWHFYRGQLRSIFANSVFSAACTDADRELVAGVQQQKYFYVSEEELGRTEFLQRIFRAVLTDPKAASAGQIAALENYQLDIIGLVALRLKDKLAGEDSPENTITVELDFARTYWQAVMTLQSYPLGVLPSTYFRLLDSLLSRAAVPFKGEPLSGLQIMGPLETRALDFDNLIVFNCNEGTFPSGSLPASFVPAELRRGFGLPTYEYQDAVWAYYFYRMIQRASRVWLVCDSRSGGLMTGEESRYIKQLEMYFGVKVRRWFYDAEIKSADIEDSVQKTPEDVEKIRNMRFSASSIKDYLSCGVKFYYSKVKGYEVSEEVDEVIDNGTYGNIFHAVMQEIYSTGGTVSVDHLRESIREERLKELVRSKMLEITGAFEVYGRNLIQEDTLRRSVYKVVSRDIEYISACGKDSIRILGLEKKCSSDFEGMHLYGVMDRIDSLTPGTVRIVDYKTGKVTGDDFIATADVAAKVFDPAAGGKRPEVALQLFIYDILAEDVKELSGKTKVNSIYQVNRLFNKPVEEIELNEEFESAMRAGLKSLFAEMTDVSIPFTRDDTGEACKYCNFKILCGR